MTLFAGIIGNVLEWYDFAIYGFFAPILLVALRILQGRSVGGEFTSFIVYLAESAPKGRRGFFSSVSLLGATGGILLGSLNGSVISG